MKNRSLSKLCLDEVWAVANHVPPITKVVYKLKYDSVYGIGKFLGDFMYEFFAVPAAEIVVSVPLHPRKKHWRGFNQSEIIARQLAKRMQLPWYDLLQRKRNSISQAGHMNREDRWKNTQTLYKIQAPSVRTLLKTYKKIPESVLLVDDVFTTGATLNACAYELKKIGVKKVIGCTVTARI